MTIEELYKYRKEIQKLYVNDCVMKGDLIDGICTVVNGKATGLDIKIQELQVTIILTDECSSGENYRSLLENLREVFRTFIKKNMDQLTIDDKQAFLNFVENGNIFNNSSIRNILRLYL